MSTATRERPILFSGPMVRAILEGRKTQTRRVVRDQIIDDRRPMMIMRSKAWDGQQFQNAEVSRGYGDIGDHLWVRETWYPHFKRSGNSNGCVYRADDDGLHLNPGWSPHDGWRPSIFMPRWASRITLEIVNVRVEQLQGITEDDARAEGCDPKIEQDGSVTCGRRKTVFFALWDSLNAKRGYGWNQNPWVWVIEFKRVT